MRLIFCLFILITPPVLAGDFKIAVIDLPQAIQATNDGKIAKKKLTQEYQFMEKTLQKKEFGLKEKIQSFEKKALLLSESKRMEQQKEIQKMSLALQQESQKFQLEIQKKQMEATRPIIAKLQKQIEILAEKKGFDLILNKGPDNVLWAKDSIDITKDVISMYEKT